MHYYSFHVSDYIHDTAHLSNEEDLAYRRLLDLYYTQEKPIPNKTHEVARRIRMGKNISAVQTVLEEFFMYDREGDFWFQKRCDETISIYQAKVERNRAVGRLGGRPKANPEETQTVSKTNPNQEPITKNQKKTVATKVARPSSVDQQIWDDWLAIRRAKKLPLTETAWSQIQGEIDASGFPVDVVIKECCLRGWAAFKVSWLKDNPITAAPAARFAGDI